MKVYYYCSLAFNIDVYLVYVYLTLTLECIYDLCLLCNRRTTNVLQWIVDDDDDDDDDMLFLSYNILHILAK